MNKLAPSILAIETATSSCSVALTHDERIYSRSEVGNNIHSQVLLSMVKEVLEEASFAADNIEAVAVGQGPGSFTGLRIGIGVAQGLAYGLNCPMIGVSSLDALAYQSGSDGHILAGIDARMGELYTCQYRNTAGQLERLTELQVLKPAAVTVTTNQLQDLYLVGNAWSEYLAEFDDAIIKQATHLTEIVYPNAESILYLAKKQFKESNTVSAANFVPEYVRNDVAKKSAAKKAVT